MLKRKRGQMYAPRDFTQFPYKSGPAYKRRKQFIPGKSRTGGFYGRFASAAGPGSGELKFHDVAIDDAVVAVGGTIQNAGTVNIIPQGVTEIQRIGRKCTVRSIHWRYLLTLPAVAQAAGANGGDSVRVILYLDKQCNGATIAATDLLETNDIHSFRNLANTGRFQILMDKYHNLNYSGLASNATDQFTQAQVTFNFQMNKKCQIPIEFSATTGALTEIRSNNLGVLLVGTGGVIGMNSVMRLRFSDS